MTEPRIDAEVFIASGAIVTGDVTLARGASVWHCAVLRGDCAAIEVGEDSNIQDGCVLHADPGFPLRVGCRVTVGHRAVLHGCTIEDEALVGMGAIVMNGAVIGRGAVVAAGALVPEGMQLPPKTLAMGVPAKVRRPLTQEELCRNRENAQEYLHLSRQEKDKAR
ncbi:MAG: gamma carbonic anhydrase family protein [Oscillospiraceae bacterium]|nr:gamma carbonic anhydrase family protein [Oscillospiraceae bacterium]